MSAKSIRQLQALLLAFAIAGAAVTASGSAAAAPGPTPNQLTGAANMVNTNARAGMENAMSANNSNGDQGMYCAVYITNAVVKPGTCR